MIEKVECESSQAVEKTIGKEVRWTNWEANEIVFEQHMLDGDSVRLVWQSGK